MGLYSGDTLQHLTYYTEHKIVCILPKQIQQYGHTDMWEKRHVHRPLTTFVHAECANDSWFVSQNTTISIESMIRWVAETVALTVSLPEGLGFISFRPLTEKK